MKRFYRVLVWMLIVLAFGSLKVDAQISERFIDVQNKAAIRYKTNDTLQGLKFTANVHKEAIEGTYGMYLAYGNVSKEEFSEAIKTKTGQDFKINDKKVFHVRFDNLTKENTFSIIITGIPKANYADSVTVLGYVVVKDIVVYSENVVSRSIAEVAFKSLNSGLNDEALTDIISEMEQKVVLSYNALNQIELNKSFYEYDHKLLKEEFNEDFKNINALGFLDLETKTEDLFNFYQDAYFFSKWEFLLDYFISLSGSEDLVVQVENLKENNPVSSLEELTYALTNFFNEENYRKNEDIIDFTNKGNYLDLKNFNNKVYINLNGHELYKVGDTIKVPEISAHEDDEIGYAFDYFMIGEVRYNPNDEYVVLDSNGVFEPKYSYKEYTLTFITEEGESLGDIKVEHNDVLLNTPEYVKEGYVIVYWLEEGETLAIDKENIISSKTRISKDMTLVPVFKEAITEINFTVIRNEYKVVDATENVLYEFDMKDKNYNYFYITPKEGYGFTKDILIVVTYVDSGGNVLGKGTFVNQTIEPEYIEYIINDPNWTKPY